MKESLIEKVKNMLAGAILNKEEAKKNVLKVLIGETQRLKDAVPSDKQVVSIVRKMIEGNREMLKYRPTDETLQLENETLTELLPPTMSEEQIRERLVSLNLHGLKIAQATGMAMKKLKEAGIDFDSKTAIRIVEELCRI